jgi:hypothetical protein
MGGYGSGKTGGRQTVEDGHTLDLSRLFKTGCLKPAAWTSGTLRWRNVVTGEEIASVGFQAQLNEEGGYVQLHWTSTNRGTEERRQCENRIALTTHPQPFGGRRWLFICPHTGRLATKLHLPSGVYTFACRKAYRLAYRSQRETSHDRALSRAFALRRKLRNDGGIGDYILKPKGMHWRTFDRAMERINQAEDVVEVHTAFLLERLASR